VEKVISLNRKQQGFTIVELLIVIVVIGILAALVLNSFTGVQARARDTERRTDINAVATQLEVYYNDKSGYPTATDVANTTWQTANLKGADAAAFTDPKAIAINGTGGSYTYNNNNGTASTTGCVSPTDSAGAANTGTPCEHFSITATMEKQSNVTKNSLN
jgi:prepilin-type N-terminal cleavage/methylation domain-containing protein